MFFADLVLLIHAAIVIFNVGGLFAIWLGAWRGWLWVRNSRFRIMHLVLILVVVVETLVGFSCPLTSLENWLRGDSNGQSFIERGIHTWLYWDLPAWVFLIVYSKFAALVAATWRLVPPAKSKMKR